jgi:hypothetical protein
MKNVLENYYRHTLMYEAGTETWIHAYNNRIMIDETRFLEVWKDRPNKKRIKT